MSIIKKLLKKAENEVKKNIPNEIREFLPPEIRHDLEKKLRDKVIPKEIKQIYEACDRATAPFNGIFSIANELYKIHKNCK